MSLRLRLNLLFALAASLAVLSGAFGRWAITSSLQALEETERRQAKQMLVQRIRSRLLQSMDELSDLVSGVLREARRGARRRQEVEQMLSTLEEGAQSEAEVGLAREIQEAVRSYDTTRRKLTFLIGRDGADIAKRWRRHVVERGEEMNEQLDRFVHFHGARLREARSEARARGARARTFMLVTIGVLLALVVAMVFLLRSWIVQPIRTLGRAAQRIPRGEYETPELVERADELGALAVEIDQMAASLAAFQRQLVSRERMAAMGEMTYAVAHNLRNPLASIRALAQGSRHAATGDEQLAESLRSIMATVDKADRWLKDLFVALRPIKVSRQPEDLRSALEEVTQSMRGYGEQRGVALEVEVPDHEVIAPVDRRRLDQALISFISNAIEASPAGERVTVSCTGGESGGHEVCLSVRDRGGGLDEKTRSKMFLPYYTTKQSGTGLGLSLAQRIVFGHDGRLTVESSPGQGCRIDVHLPLRSEGTDRDEAADEAEGTGSDGTDPDRG